MLAAQRMMQKMPAMIAKQSIVLGNTQIRQYKSMDEVPRRRDIQFMMDNRIPVDLQGTLKLPKIPTRDLIDEYYTKRSLSDDLLKEHFLSMISQLFNGIVTKDEAVINKIAEPQFAAKIIEKAEEIKGVKYTAPPDDAIEKTYLIDKIFI